MAQNRLVFALDDGRTMVENYLVDTQKRTLIDHQLMKLLALGYLYAGVDSLGEDTVHVHVGERFIGEIGTLRIYEQAYDSLRVLDLGKSKSFESTISQLLSQYNNAGYPFVQLQLSGLELEKQTFHADMVVRPGPMIRFDSIALLGQQEAGVGLRFLSRALEIESGMPFSEASYLEIPHKLQRLPFLNLSGSPEVTFSEGKATVYLDLEEQKENRFEGVIGFLPKQSAQDQLAVTGYLDLGLSNLFRSGKTLDFSWNRFADESQSVNMDYYHPFILSSPLFLEVGFELLKQDSTFIGQGWAIQTGAFLAKSAEVTFGFESATGSLIDPEELSIADGIADFKSRLYSVGFGTSFYDRPMPFANGIKYQVRGGIGDKQIIKNPAISSDAYDTLTVTTRSVKFTAGTKYLFILKNRLALFHQLEGQLFFNDQLLTNELARVGGLRSVRGFNENFFYAQHYAFSRMEIRQYFEKSSYFMVFYDQLAMQNLLGNTYPRGFGVGLTLATSNGLFTFATALGTSREVAIQPNNVKIHLGYISRF